MKRLVPAVQVGGHYGLLVMSPLWVFLVDANQDRVFLWVQVLMAVVGTTAWIAAISMLARRPKRAKLFGILAIVLAYGIALPAIQANPFIALGSTVVLIWTFFFFADLPINVVAVKHANHHVAQQYAQWAIMSLFFISTAWLIFGLPAGVHRIWAVITAGAIAWSLFILWAVRRHQLVACFIATIAILVAGGVAHQLGMFHVATVGVFSSLAMLVSLPRKKHAGMSATPYRDFLLDHPARVLLSTFLGLCLVGTLLLVSPFASSQGPILLIDAAFTAVSAVCVTGLIVLDTPVDFSLFGHVVILVLIQLGGLGIMSIATVALHALGRRLTLKQERMLTTMTNSNHRDVVQALILVLKFTLLVELIGAVLLTLLFHSAGDGWGTAAWRGVFTAVSAFCNAGFALQSDSLLAYQAHPAILHTVAVLIVAGGLAPATCLAVPRLFNRKPIPVVSLIPIVTTLALLLVGTVLMLAFEWNDSLVALSLMDKIHNAWFQSVTLRTAGFNAIDLTTVGQPMLILMHLFMFIGGSPGGTAGGIKTTTLAILLLTFWANITKQNQVVLQNRRILHVTVYRAVTIFMAGAFVWFLVVLMLTITQQIPTKPLLFEATSAIATVGLSLGATNVIDGLGKVIIIVAMFVGRIGPITFFMIFSNRLPSDDERCPEIDISLT